MNLQATDLAGEATASLRLGQDLRSLRKARGLTLAELSLRLGRSVGWLSQVERGLSEPGIGDLRALAAVFEVPLSFFFANESALPEEQGLIVRRDARRSLGNSQGGLVEELLSPDLGGSFELLRSVFAPGAASPGPAQRPTEEAGYVVAGSLILNLRGEDFLLQAGDSFRFKEERFSWRNPGDEPCIVIWVVAPPLY
ncbi:MAG: XRE family transcriptional regulator [Rhodospirillales bacterium]